MRRALSRALALTLAAPLALALSTATARADEATDKAKMLFNMGAQAYDSGQFPTAIQAFEEAYRAAPRPGIVFSMAQAYRRQYYLDKKPETLRSAVRAYHTYLDKDEQGARRAEAAESLSELEPLLARLESSAGPEVTAARRVSEVKTATRLMISSPTADAMISVDGGALRKMPFISEVSPGNHKVRLSAPGYFEEARDVQAVPDAVTVFDLPLRERPARLLIRSNQDGAQISIDGRLMATTPIARTLDVEPGAHLMNVAKNGYRPWSAEFTVERNEGKPIDIKLAMTGQRITSFTLGGVAVASAVVGVGFAAHAFQKQRDADAVNQDRFYNTKNVICEVSDASPCTLAQKYFDARTARDLSRALATGAFGFSLAVGSAGILAYILDTPSFLTPLKQKERAPKVTPRKEMPTEIGAAPLVGPGLYGATLTGRF